MAPNIPFLILLLFPFTLATITHDTSCTTFLTGQLSYLPTATMCFNAIDDSICEQILTVLSPESVLTYPTPGGTAERPSYCSTPDGLGGAKNDQLKRFFIENCPRSCGYCCETMDFTACNDAPNTDCKPFALTCDSVTWHSYILRECPATCGYCGRTKCFDRASTCTLDMCTSDLKFAANSCKKTCGLCNLDTTMAPTTSAILG